MIYVMLIVKDLEYRPSICDTLGWTMAMSVVSLELNVSAVNVQER